MTFKTTKIPLSQTGQFSKLMIDYINGDDSLRSFYTYSPNINSFKQAIEDKSKARMNRELLVKVLKEQYEKSRIQTSNAELLLDTNTFTVCTGHQLCLFTGPLYFVYKIITTINLAQALKKKYPEYNFVPVYWMATEDHDFEEVKSIHLFGKKISWENAAAAGAVGGLDTRSLQTVIEELKTILGDSENSKQLIQLFSDAYLKQNNLADATRCLVNALFGEYGLIILDGNDARLKLEFIDILKDDILNNTNYKLVTQTNTKLDELDYKTQVSPREINCFYMVDGVRERIERVGDKGDGYKVLNTEITFTKDRLLTELKDHPERFSPNVVTRPIYQQIILPNLAYVGGPGEIAYWLEYKAMFDHHKVNFPILIPRNFAMLTDERTDQQIQKLGFEFNDIFKDVDTLNKEYVKKNAGSDLSLNEQELKLTAIYSEISAKASAVDITLKGSVEAEMQKGINALKNIESKIVRAEKQKQETSIQQIKKIKDKFFPEGMLQERYDNVAPYYLKQGRSLIPLLKEQFDPFDHEMMIIEI